MSVGEHTNDIAVMNWMRDEPVRASMERAARVGFSALEFAWEPARMEAAAVRAGLNELRLSCWGAATLMKDGRDLAHPDSYIRRATLEYVKDTIRWVAAVGGSVVTVTPAIGKLAPAADPEREWAWLVEGLREAQELAGELGIRMGMELLCRFETYLCNTVDRGLQLVHDVGGGFGVVLDVFHMNIEEADMATAIGRAAPHLVDFHVAANTRHPPGQGALHWTRILEALTAADYRGCLTVEFFYSDALTAEQYDADVAASATFLRDLLASRQVGGGRS